MSQRKAVTKAIATRYQRADRTGKKLILDELCALTGWHRDHARKALRQALTPPVVRPRRPRPPVYGEEVIAALPVVWAVMDAPAGKRMAPFLPEIVDRLRAVGELTISDGVRDRLVSMSAATIDRRLAGDRARLRRQGPVGHQAGIAAVVPDPDPHLGGLGRRQARVRGDRLCRARGRRPERGLLSEPGRHRHRHWLDRAARGEEQGTTLGVRRADGDHRGVPVPDQGSMGRSWRRRCGRGGTGIDSDNGSEFINAHLLRYYNDNEITFTRSRPGNKNDGAHIEQKNWSVVRRAVGYHRNDTAAELALLNQIYALVRLQINFFAPQQKLVSKTRIGAKVIKKYDIARTPYQRVLASPTSARRSRQR